MFQFAAFASLDLCIQSRMTQRAGFPHSDICGSKLICQLPTTFRRLSRPSSPVIAKASTTCTYSLDPITRMSPRYRLSFRVVPYSKSSFDHLNTSWYNHNPYNFHAPSLTRFRCTTTSSKLLKNKYCMTLLSFKNIHILGELPQT